MSQLRHLNKLAAGEIKKSDLAGLVRTHVNQLRNAYMGRETGRGDLLGPPLSHLLAAGQAG